MAQELPQPFNPDEVEHVLLGDFRQFHVALARRELDMARSGDAEAWRKPQVFVDNRMRAGVASIDAVQFGGKIEFAAEALREVVEFIWRELLRRAEAIYDEGDYLWSLRLYANSKAYSGLDAVPQSATEFNFYPLVPYARKIENGASKKARTGVFKPVFRAAQSRYGRSVKLRFGWTVPKDADARAVERTNRFVKKKRVRGYVAAVPAPIIYLRQGGDFS